MRRIVLDTMVLASGFTSNSGAAALLLQLWRSESFDLVVSGHTLQELARTLNEDRYVAARTMACAVATFLASLRRKAIVTPLAVSVVGVATHPEDDLILATALSGRSTVLCTQDKQLLKFHSYQSWTS